MKLFLSILSIILGFFVFAFWLAGSHGHIMFRPGMLEDWILSVLLLIFFGIPIFFGIAKRRKK